MKRIHKSLGCFAILASAHLASPETVLAAEVPNFNQITLGTLPGFRAPGSLTVPAEVTNLLGYDPSRQWRGQERLADVLQLGDLQGHLALEQFTLEQISAITGIDLRLIQLSELALLDWQTLGDLVAAVPDLRAVSVRSLPLISDVLGAAGISFNNRITLGQLLETPSLAALPLNRVDLSAYALTDLPGVSETPLQNFRDWERSSISGVPGLAQVPFSDFPGAAVLQIATPAFTDIVFGTAEGNVTRTISGSYEEGFNVPCRENCAHVELGAPYEGYQWVSGLSQMVRGGHGFLGSVNNGLEPTGRHPFGDSFKVVVLETDEALGTAQTGLYFRFCIKRRFLDLGCTPYFIGPVPWLPVQEEGIILL